jgi:hypothetical protein
LGGGTFVEQSHRGFLLRAGRTARRVRWELSV